MNANPPAGNWRKALLIAAGIVGIPLICWMVFGAGPSVSVQTIPAFNTGNKANDMLLALPESAQISFLAVVANKTYPENGACVGLRAFYMGTSPKDRDAYWSIGCADGNSYQVEIAPNATGTTSAADCRILHAVNVNCFVRLDGQ